MAVPLQPCDTMMLQLLSGDARARRRTRRRLVTGLGVLGLLDSLYMLAYSEGLVDSLVCPFFGTGCDVVGRSEHARHFGVPNSAVGALGYAALATLAAWSGDAPARRRPGHAFGVAGIAVAAAAASAFLTWEQHAKVRAWCFWCLASAGITAALLPLALADAGEALAGDRPTC